MASTVDERLAEASARMRRFKARKEVILIEKEQVVIDRLLDLKIEELSSKMETETHSV